MTTELALVLGYALGLVALGILIGRRVGSAKQFFVAGRSLGPVLLGATLLAANIGAGSTVGAAALGYEYGISAWWWVGSAGIGTLLLAFWVGPAIWQTARDHDLLTVGDYLEWRYDARARFTATLLLWAISPAVLAAQLIAVAFILNAVAGVPLLWGAVIAGVVVTVYFTAGGLVSSAWVNLVQLVVLGIGLVVAIPVVADRAGGWSAVVSTYGLEAEFDALVHSYGPGWHYAIFLVPAFMVSPGLLQKVYGARDPRAIRLGVGIAGIALLLFAAVPVYLGMYGRVWDSSLVGDATSFALPTVLTLGMPLLLGTLGLAAVFSAEISSADAVLFMFSTSLSEDLYRRFVNPDASDAEVLRVARVGAILGGVAGTALAVGLGSVITALRIFYGLLSVGLFVPVIGGLLWRRAGGAAGVVATLGGITGYLVGHLVFDLPARAALSPASLGLAVSATAFLVAGLAATDKARAA